MSRKRVEFVKTLTIVKKWRKVMYTGDNKIAKQSQAAVVDTLAGLLKEKKFSEISISELCKKSGVSRQTFYTWFKTKENIIEYNLETGSSFVLESKGDAITLAEICQHFTSYVEQNYSFLSIIIKNGLSRILYKSFYHKLYNDTLLTVCENEAERKYIASFLAGGFFSIITVYIEDKQMKEKDLERMTINLFSGAYFSKMKEMRKGE